MTERDRLWGDGVGRAFEVVVFAVVTTAVLGAGAAYVVHQTSSTESTQSEPLPWPEIDLSLPTPPPYLTPSPSEPASVTPEPTLSKPVKPRPSGVKPRPKPPTVKPRVPVRLLSEAESPQHQFSGNTRPRSNKAASGDFVVGWLGNGSRNRLGLSVTVPDADRYLVTFFYISADYRDAVVSVNDGAETTIAFPPTEDWSTVRSLVLTLPLRAGQNTIELSNPDYYGPDIDRIMVIR
ncbi:MAG TPA: hypothetical protein VFR67_03230 [Pilimelia sp.]|nr:hypothetical protein [Pilimelia sp.]